MITTYLLTMYYLRYSHIWAPKYVAQRAKFVEKVHKPPLRVNVINFELNGLKMHQYGSLGLPQTPQKCDALIEVFQFIRYV